MGDVDTYPSLAKSKVSLTEVIPLENGFMHSCKAASLLMGPGWEGAESVLFTLMIIIGGIP